MRKPKLTTKDHDALCNMIDLAAQTVADAEFDHTEFTGRRRNGGYSMDYRNALKALDKVKKLIEVAK